MLSILYLRHQFCWRKMRQLGRETEGHLKAYRDFAERHAHF